MAEQKDFIKEYKDLYLPGKKPVLVTIPKMPFIWVNGLGSPDGDEYKHGLGLLYSLSYTIKMSVKKGEQPSGYYAYKVPPLEGLWVNNGTAREDYQWTSLIRQPDFVTEAVFNWAVEKAAAKKPELDFSKAQFGYWEEGLCIQALHVGPFSTESETIALLQDAMKQQNLCDDSCLDTLGPGRRHHEIYLKDYTRVAPEKMQTVLRYPVAKR